MTHTSEFIRVSLEETVSSYGQPSRTVRVVWEMRRDEIARGVLLWDDQSQVLDGEYEEVRT